MERYDVIVVGAGASGMMAALAAAEAGASVVLLDGNDKAGKKLYATGNGRCNFTNMNMNGSEWARGFFAGLGMMSRVEDEGRCYPYSGQAAALVRALENGLVRAGAVVRLGDRVAEVSRVQAQEQELFCAVCDSGASYLAEGVVIATGGRAGLKFGSTGDGYGFAKAFGHTLEPPRPALVAVESDDEFIAELKGVRAKAAVSLELNGERIAEESGEIQFTGTGISGICVFDLSRFMDAPRPRSAKKKKKNKSNKMEAGDVSTAQRACGRDDAAAAALAQVPERRYIIAVDLAPEHDWEGIVGFLRGALTGTCGDAHAVTRADFENIIAGIVNSKLAGVIADMAWIGGEPEKSVKRAAHILKRLKVSVLCTKGWDDAQVTKGGVRLDEVDGETMESQLMPGLFLCGEVLDFDGRCGGYNLQWAWQTGHAAGRAAALRCKNLFEHRK